ncbi:hypothetical protein K144313037_21660 [Clostridium tetani]|uniref:DUF2326 domain-containing protein n=1 Tax=Clostridium tetani TaxID=1513 RepID=A0A4V1LEC9_CLOTA|nr:DUF2326 domain-containing protein [Clostridium tetani]RXI44565.1 DUF2326 domain-containing protein [Clostridium tetani]BDR65325.1 hypothetical protein K134307016_22590 [Clostridium tetani]BDR68148.1 hypothetical protein K144312032_23760 [Clostridium tetani]BDR70754.1 hypothetical protein K144313037_21660 [Clostridium tetani]BEV20392.1 DUF2326 domain-containing protein [Clostridium tetani]
MFIKSLKIESPRKIIREIKFRPGINFIVDETPNSQEQLTGNNVGKTTVLKLVDFCLGADKKIIYTDLENPKEKYDLVEEFLIEQEILITLILVKDFYSKDESSVIIERNFLSGKKAIRRINGEQEKVKDFEKRLLELIIPEHKSEKPTFRQIISHNIRYKDENINNTLKTLNKYTSDLEYETLYLFMLGCKFDEGAKKQIITEKISQEIAYKNRLEKKQTKNAYEIALSILDDEIKKLNEKKSSFNLNEDFESDLQKLNEIKYEINKISSNISRLKIRKNLIIDAEKDLNKNISNIDLKQLEIIYSQATNNISGIQKTFEDLVKYHNDMILEKIRFITQELPELEEKIDKHELRLTKKLREEKEISLKLTKGKSFEELEEIIKELNDKYRQKGEIESIISQLNEVEGNIEKYQNELDGIENILFTDDFESKLMEQVKKFNKYFSMVSEELYGEKYALKYDKVISTKTGKQFFKFSSFNANLSSGKKQGEILCFDIAYTMFADDEGISCLHFLLNDKKELMHDNQLLNMAEYIENKNIQLVISILKDKLPKELDSEDNIILKLSQDDKLFRIEKLTINNE